MREQENNNTSVKKEDSDEEEILWQGILSSIENTMKNLEPKKSQQEKCDTRDSIFQSSLNEFEKIFE